MMDAHFTYNIYYATIRCEHVAAYKFLLFEPYLPPLLKIIAVINTPNISRKCAEAVNPKTNQDPK